MNQQRSGCLVLALIGSLVLLGLSVLVNLVLAGSASTLSTASRAPLRFEETTLVPAPQRDESEKIVVIHIRGIISGMRAGGYGDTAVDDIKLQLKQAAEDERVKAVVLHIDSPGGEVTASDTIYNAVRRFRDEQKKPVVVFMGSLAASGGYYVACGGSYLMATDTTFTGSIGVIMQTLKYKQLFEKVGLEQVVFKSGPLKDMLSGARDLTEEERDYVQKMIMQTYDKFVGIVAKERKLPEDELRNGPADGRVISGKDALEAKLIDEIGEIEGAYKKAAELGNAKNARIVRYESPFKLSRLLGFLGQEEVKRVELDVTSGLVPRLEAGRAYYLPSIFAP
jgi:protease-4